ncbi:hypothetical protein HMPREF9071_2336 [Capnocytophaga sp. oral taxon 338 str. F0234]|nr:hypothetical protein HMPREF9071_2336 [Capnocytophaga sp. oral taxon 338 str. F0234]
MSDNNIRTNDSNGGSKAGNYNDLYEIESLDITRIGMLLI